MTPEGALSVKVMKWLRSVPNIYARKVNDFNNVGMPDIDGCFKGQAFYIELKSKRGRLSTRQAYELSKIEWAGGRVLVARSLDEVQTVFERWFGVKAGDKIKSSAGISQLMQQRGK